MRWKLAIVAIWFASVAAAAGVPPLRVDPALLGRLEKYLSEVEQAAASIRFEALGGVTSKDVDLFEIDRELLKTSVKRARELTATLRTACSPTDAFLLSVALDSGRTFLSGMMDRLQKYQQGNHPAADKMKAFTWSSSLFQARFSETVTDYGASVEKLLQSADKALDACGGS